MRHASRIAWIAVPASIPPGVDANSTSTRTPGAARQLPLVLVVTLVVCVLPAFVAPLLVTADGIRSVIAAWC